MIDYWATKGVIVSFTRGLAKQLVSEGTKGNAVTPGPVHTPIQAASRHTEQMEGFEKNLNLVVLGSPVRLYQAVSSWRPRMLSYTKITCRCFILSLLEISSTYNNEVRYERSGV